MLLMDFTYISNNKTAGKDIRYNIPGHFSFATFYTYLLMQIGNKNSFHFTFIWFSEPTVWSAGSGSMSPDRTDATGTYIQARYI